MGQNILKKFFLVIASMVLFLALSIFAWKIYDNIFNESNRGINLNKRAWEASYVERDQQKPKSGPREGYWGFRLGSKIPDNTLGWHEPQAKLPCLIDINADGYQFYRTTGKKKYDILILGGSVAFGAQASEISKTYFHILGTILDNESLYSDITVFASGAWKSSQELKALILYTQTTKPDLIIFLNGLNDITNGATSKVLFGEEVPTIDGSSYTVLYHAHDYKQRVIDYLSNMRKAIKKAKDFNSNILIVLQPSLVERQNRSKIEDILLKRSLIPHASSAAILESYASIRQELYKESLKEQHVSFLDCSTIFDSEKETTFTDMWHFSDYGHEILGKVMAKKILSIIQKNYFKIHD